MDPDQLRRDTTAFGLALLRRVGLGEGNLVISPQSIAVAVGMAVAGAEGQTAEGLRRAVGWSRPDPYPHGAFRELAGAFEAAAEGDDVWASANRAWFRGAPRAEYARVLRENYAAEPGVLDVDPARAAEEMNSWIAQRTRWHLRGVVDPMSLDVMVRFVLVNAAYFKGLWSVPFDPARTAPAAFRRLVGGSSVVPMMSGSVPGWYSKGPGFSAATLRYRGGSTLQIILPDVGEMARVTGALTVDLLDALEEGEVQAELDLWFPRLTLETSRDVGRDLKGLGAVRAFGSDAEFGKVGLGPKLYLSNVLHCAKFVCDEKGSEAAAVTVTLARGLGRDRPARAEFHVDRPFLFLLRRKGVLLFAGRVVDPSA